MTHNRRTTILLVATVAGVLIGGILGWMLGGHGTEGEAHAGWIASESRGLWLQLVTFPGTAFLNILKMLVLPLVMASMVCGVASLGASKTTGKLGKHAVFYYTATTLAATLVGIALVSLVQPGVGSTLVANPDSLGA